VPELNLENKLVPGRTLSKIIITITMTM
jgi:hypothetical protein